MNCVTRTASLQKRMQPNLQKIHHMYSCNNVCLRCFHKYAVKFNYSKVSQQRAQTHSQEALDSDKLHLTFSKIQEMRRAEARRSVLIQLKKNNYAADAHKHCLKYGRIRNIFLHNPDASRHFMLVEFANRQSAIDIVNRASFFPSDEENYVTPHRSRHFYFKFRKQGSMPLLNARLSPDISVVPTYNAGFANLQAGKSVEEQMRHLFLSQQMTEFGSRIRYFVCSLLEDMFTHMFDNCQVLPFGSSVNGFGKSDCDLDMIFETGVKPKKMKDGDILLFKTKKVTEEREFCQQTLDLFAKLLLHVMPVCVNVRRVLHARIPIVKFDHVDTELQCDLTIGNRSGVHMSELFYIFANLDNRVRPLVFTVRHWARTCGVTRSDPGTWITNYQLTLLVLFSLQRQAAPLLPSIEQMKKLAGPEDSCFINDEDYTFVKDVRKIPGTRNQTDLGDLLKSFFKFYSEFNFKDRGISLVQAKTIEKPEDFPMYLQNPLEQELNASKNVSEEEVELFQGYCHQALQVLDDPNNKKGLVGLFDKAMFNNSWTESEEGLNFDALFGEEGSDKVGSVDERQPTDGLPNT